MVDLGGGACDLKGDSFKAKLISVLVKTSDVSKKKFDEPLNRLEFTYERRRGGDQTDHNDVTCGLKHLSLCHCQEWLHMRSEVIVPSNIWLRLHTLRHVDAKVQTWRIVVAYKATLTYKLHLCIITEIPYLAPAYPETNIFNPGSNDIIYLLIGITALLIYITFLK